MGDPIDIGQGEQASQVVLCIHHHQLVNSRMLGKDPICHGNGIIAQILLSQSHHFITR